MDQPVKVVFILGSGHSGSTLLDLLLNAHPDIVGLGEAEKIGVKVAHPETNCSCGKDFHECPFWGGYIIDPQNKAFLDAEVRHIYQGKLNFLLGRKRYRFIKNGSVKITPTEYVCATERLYRHALHMSGAKVVVDSTKGAFRPEALLHYGANIELYIVHLIRDGRGVLFSYQKKYPRTLKWIIRWVMSNFKVEILKWRLPVHSRRVLYRDVTAEPSQVVNAILRDLGLDSKSWNESFRRAEHHYIGGNMPTVESHRAVEHDNEWEQKLSPYSRVSFTMLAGWLNWCYQRWVR